MEMATTHALITCLYFSLYFHCSFSSPSRPPIGVHPLDLKYYDAELIKCKDGSKTFTRNRLNDDFCDCADGTDEPGTLACPSGRFYCKNTRSTPKFLFSSHVNDQICDCCDGSDEYDGTAICSNTCVMGGNIVYQGIKYDSTARNMDSINSRKTKLVTEMEDSTYKLIGLKALVFSRWLLSLFLWLSVYLAAAILDEEIHDDMLVVAILPQSWFMRIDMMLNP